MFNIITFNGVIVFFQDTSRLNVDAVKSRVNLRKKGTLAKRRPPSKQFRQSLDPETFFQGNIIRVK